MKINHPIKGRIEYQPYPYQQELIDLMKSGQNVIVKSSRQMGLSTTMFAAVREMCLETPNHKALVVTSNGWGDYGLNKFPDDTEIKHRTKKKIEFNNGSVIEFVPGTKVEHQTHKDHDVYYDLYEFISEKTKTNMEREVGDDNVRFYSFTGVTDFERNGFIPLKWSWDLHPERDQEWLDFQRDILGEKRFNEEILL